MLIPFLLWQESFNLLLYTAELFFFRIRECRVVLQRKLAGVPDHGKLLVGKKARLVYQTGAGSKVLLCRFVVSMK